MYFLTLKITSPEALFGYLKIKSFSKEVLFSILGGSVLASMYFLTLKKYHPRGTFWLFDNKKFLHGGTFFNPGSGLEYFLCLNQPITHELTDSSPLRHQRITIFNIQLY